MKNMTELRLELTKVFEKLRDGRIKLKEAAEMNNTAGKIINTVRAELEYAKLTKTEPKIAFIATRST